MAIYSRQKTRLLVERTGLSRSACWMHPSTRALEHGWPTGRGSEGERRRPVGRKVLLQHSSSSSSALPCSLARSLWDRPKSKRIVAFGKGKTQKIGLGNKSVERFWEICRIGSYLAIWNNNKHPQKLGRCICIHPSSSPRVQLLSCSVFCNSCILTIRS